jgi:hypothetical protein
MQTRYDLRGLFLLVLLGAATTAQAQVRPELARRYFEEATKLCERDAGRLWGVSLCGPMVIVDQATGTRATSQPEPEGPPPRFPGFVDGFVSWGGLRWFSFPLYMLPENDADARQQVMLHGLFHRIQPELGFITDDGFNEHLDTLEGRIWMQLEWRALRRAIESSASDRANAVADAIFPAPRTTSGATRFAKGSPPTPASRPGPIRPRMPTVPQQQHLQEANRSRRSSEISKPRLDPATVCCWTISCRDGADRFVAPRTLATCSPRQPTGHRRRTLPWQRRATMGQRCERRRRRAIGRSRSASPSCVDASLMGPC